MRRYMMENPAAGDGGASECLAGRLDAPDNSRNRCAMQCSAEIDGPRFERMVARVHALGVRPLAEMLAEIAIATGKLDLIADHVEAYARLDPEIVRALGADSFPPMPLGVVR